MFNILSTFSILIIGKGLIKEHTEKKNPNTHAITDWDSYRQDVLSGVSNRQRMNNLSCGKYQRNMICKVYEEVSEIEKNEINEKYKKLYELVRTESYAERHERIQNAMDNLEKMKINF